MASEPWYRVALPRQQEGTAVAARERSPRYGDRDGADERSTARLGGTTLDEEKRLLDAMLLAVPR